MDTFSRRCARRWPRRSGTRPKKPCRRRERSEAAPTPPFDPSLLLFVPGDRPDRFAKALASGASGIILDLEDAVAPDRKPYARDAVRTWLASASDRSRVAVRINPGATEAGARDLRMLASLGAIAACVVPKAERTEDLARVGAMLEATAQIAIVETALGIVNCEALASETHLLALAFGPYDLAASLGCQSEADVMLPYRARVLVAARAAGRWAIDGPSREYGDPTTVARDATHARRLGYDGKLLVHPSQIAPVRASFTPSAEELDAARRIVNAARTTSPATLDGAMIDAPIVAAAERTLRRSGS